MIETFHGTLSGQRDLFWVHKSPKHSMSNLFDLNQNNLVLKVGKNRAENLYTFWTETWRGR